MSSLVPADITDIVTIIADGIGGDQTTAILMIYIVAHEDSWYSVIANNLLGTDIAVLYFPQQ